MEKFSEVIVKYILLTLFLTICAFSSVIKANETKYVANEVPEKMSVAEKKKRFYALLVPAVQKNYKKLIDEYNEVLNYMKTQSNLEKIEELKQYYKVQSDEELLYALKPHPPSIVLAQAAMESAWATSRFFTQANNVFGVWSVNKHEPRIAASEKRGGTKTIWLRKFNTIEESIASYYKLLATSKAYKEFREIRYVSDDVHKMVSKLHRYSEMGELYGEELSKLIKYNKLTKYDAIEKNKNRG